MEFLQEYGLFVAKAATAVIAGLIVLSAIAGLVGRSREGKPDRLNVKRLNDRFERMEKTVRRAVERRRGRVERLRHWAARKLPRKGMGDSTATTETEQTDKLGGTRSDREADAERPRVYVLRFDGDIRASSVESLREEVTAILTMARPEQDRAIVCLESPGGLVPSYGLAAAQLARLREAGLDLTVAVDRVAASGGYMMAAVGHRIVAAPFAVLGSIGVVAQIPNFHRWLSRNDIDIELLTAGEYKRTLTMLGENTDEGRKKFREQLEEAHELFKTFLARYRPQLDLDQVATGEHWYGEQAREMGLADELRTSDDLLLELTREADVFELTYHRPQTLGRRITFAMESILERVLRSQGPETRM
ncbi:MULTISPECIES: protease SohB [Thioalkalivibrio]|uniref:Peptidase S49 n=1 Tax=Thioalkalivibrio versutus TaxID=106634 RepID=A0A0G3G2J0_9GAMM|nr:MULTISPECIES: protease SohB [Thioalkalivibrio]AKJ95430.1 peptidase S49 [Thioalkalivibrio versutus]